MRWHVVSIGAMALALTATDIGISQGKKDAKTGEINTPPALGERKTTKLRVGDSAPDFTLRDVKKKSDVTLSNFAKQKPVVLIFGSYT